MDESWFGFACVAAGIVVILVSNAIGAIGREKI